MALIHFFLLIREQRTRSVTTVSSKVGSCRRSDATDFNSLSSSNNNTVPEEEVDPISGWQETNPSMISRLQAMLRFILNYFFSITGF
jgi:hypothetical protein